MKEGESTEFFTTAGYRSQTGRHNNLFTVRVRMNTERGRKDRKGSHSDAV